MPTSTRKKWSFYGGFPANPCRFPIFHRRGGRPCPPTGNARFYGNPMRIRNISMGGQSRPPLQRVLKITRVMRKIAASPVCTIDFHTSNIGRHHGVSGARNRPVLQTPGAFVKSIFYVVGVDAHIDPQETAVLWRFSGKSVLVFISRRRGGRPCPPAGNVLFHGKPMRNRNIFNGPM